MIPPIAHQGKPLRIGVRTDHPRCLSRVWKSSTMHQFGSNWNGATETDILLSDDRWTVKLISFEAFVSPTVTDMDPLHLSVRLSSLVDVVTIFSPRRYNGCCFDFSASELPSLAIVEFLAAYLPSALLWSSETAWSTAFRVSKESHSGLASQPLRRIRKGKPQKTIGRLQKYGIEVRRAPRVEIPLGQPVRRGIVPCSAKATARAWSLLQRGGLTLES
jgi:hypothetical protein